MCANVLCLSAADDADDAVAAACSPRHANERTTEHKVELGNATTRLCKIQQHTHTHAFA